MNKIIFNDLKYATEDKIKELLEESQNQVTASNLEALGDLIDIHKDIANEEYWCMKEGGEEMYDTYERRGRDSYGRYDRDYSARRRDSRGRYKGHDYIDDMYDYYSRYMDGRSRYGATEDTDKSFHYMVEALEDFIKVLHEEADTQQQKQQLRDTLQRSMM